MELPDWWPSEKSCVIADCLDIMKDMPDGCIDLIVTDPPYHQIKKVEWDNQHKNLAEYIDWIGEIGREIHRILKDNGSFYIFGDEKNIAYVQVELDKYFVLLNNMVWYKRNNISIKWAHNHRSFAPVSERILFYSKQDRTGLERVMLDINNFQTLRKYFQELQEYIGLGLKKINETVGHRRAEHCFYWKTTQWDLPTKETYQELIDAFTIDEWAGYKKYEALRHEYEALRHEYEALRHEYEDLRRVYNHQLGIYEVIDIPIINNNENTKHPTTKPVELFEILIKTSSNPADVVFDPFLGSGTTLLACRKTNRIGLGCEISPEYEPIIASRSMRNIQRITDYES